MVERGHQPDVGREQHAVAEDVTGHVADPDAGEVLALAVAAHLAEMPLHRLPGAAGGDAHRLVVVAGRPAGSECVAEPEAVVDRDAVGDVGERRGALVGGHDEVRVVRVVANHPRRRHDAAVRRPVVRHVEKGSDEGLVALDALGQPRLTVHGRVRQALGDEAALGADWHDDGVLDRLGLDQPEHLGTEVLPAVGPPQPTSCYGSEAQVHAFHPRRVDPHLEHRARIGQFRDGRRIELEGQRRAGLLRELTR